MAERKTWEDRWNQVKHTTLAATLKKLRHEGFQVSSRTPAGSKEDDRCTRGKVTVAKTPPSAHTSTPYST
jgi:hypothetical protein